MTLDEFLDLPLSEENPDRTPRMEICDWVNGHIDMGYYEGGPEGSIGTHFYFCLAVITPKEKIRPEDVEKCIDKNLSQFFTRGSRRDLKTAQDVIKVWERTSR